MANQYAAIDPNRFPAILGHSGTAGTAETRRLVVTADGALLVDLAGTEPVVVQIGTIVAGTINTGTVNTGTINTGTVDLLKAGTISEVTNGSIVVTNGTVGAGTVLTLDSLAPSKYDYISAAYPDGTTETYTYNNGGSGGTTIATLTVTYTDSTKGSISAIASV